MSRNLISTLTEAAWNDCDHQAIYEGENYYEYYINRTDFENRVYDIIKDVLEDYEITLQKKLEDSGVTVDIDTLMDETQKEIGL